MCGIGYTINISAAEMNTQECAFCSTDTVQDDFWWYMMNTLFYFFNLY
jgi:hypothetical protein